MSKEFDDFMNSVTNQKGETTMRAELKEIILIARCIKEENRTSERLKSQCDRIEDLSNVVDSEKGQKMRGYVIGGYESMTDSYQVMQMLELYNQLVPFGIDNYYVDAKRDFVVFISSAKDIRIEEAEIKTILKDGKYTEFYPIVYKEQDKAIFFFKKPIQDKSKEDKQ